MSRDGTACVILAIGMLAECGVGYVSWAAVIGGVVNGPTGLLLVAGGAVIAVHGVRRFFRIASIRYRTQDPSGDCLPAASGPTYVPVHANRLQPPSGDRH